MHLIKTRQQQLAQWVINEFSGQDDDLDTMPLKPVNEDAGFRKYFRVQLPGGSFIAVDAPPATEDTATFIAIAEQWRAGQVRVPQVIAADIPNGFMVQEDFGDTLLQSIINQNNADVIYQQCFHTLRSIQQQPHETLPAYDHAFLTFELSLYPQWFLQKLLGLDVEIPELAPLFQTLVGNILEQPIGTIHRDFHSRNLMLLPEGELGVIDFQGALYGPQLYDLVSLLKDCYLKWPEQKVQQWLFQFAELHPQLSKTAPEQLQRWFDLTGLQRHLKCLGIFARLHLRDNKPGYLADIPRVLEYVLEVCKKYPQFQQHAYWLEQRVQPILPERLNRVLEGINI